MPRKAILVVKLFLCVFCGLGVYLLISNLMLRESLKKISKSVATMRNKDSEQHNKLREDIKRGLEEKYRADMISYQVVQKRLEQERNRQKQPQEKIGEPAKNIKQEPQKGGKE